MAFTPPGDNVEKAVNARADVRYIDSSDLTVANVKALLTPARTVLAENDSVAPRLCVFEGEVKFKVSQNSTDVEAATIAGGRVVTKVTNGKDFSFTGTSREWDADLYAKVAGFKELSEGAYILNDDEIEHIALVFDVLVPPAVAGGPFGIQRFICAGVQFGDDVEFSAGVKVRTNIPLSGMADKVAGFPKVITKVLYPTSGSIESDEAEDLLDA